MHAVRITGIAVATVLFLSAGVALAEEGTRSGIAPRVKPEAVRAEFKERAMTAASTTKAQVRDIKETAQERVKAIREEAQERVKALKENAQQRITELRDKKKQETVQKLATRLEELNKTWTDRFAKLLDRYDALIEKMQKRSDTAAANGKNVTTANAAIQSARDAVAVAKAAVAAQTAKTYTLDVTSTPPTTATTTSGGQDELLKALRSSFQNMHRALFADLYALRDDEMRAAREAVQNALQTLGKVRGVDEGTTPTATSSSQ